MSARTKDGSARVAVPVVDDVRHAVLAAAVRLIDEGGLAKLSMREVARVAGVSHQAPYHYFEDRESILAALAEEGFNTLAEGLEKARSSSDPPLVRFASLARVYVEFSVAHTSLFRLMFRPDFVDMDRFPNTKECGERAFASLTGAVSDCLAAGLPAEPSPQALVVMAWSFAHGLACLVLDGPLSMKMPELASAKGALIDDAVSAMQRLLLAAMPNGGDGSASGSTGERQTRRKASSKNGATGSKRSPSSMSSTSASKTRRSRR